MEDLNFYKKIFIFQDLDGEELQKVLQLARHRFFSANSVIIKEGESGDSMYIMREGEVNITKRLTLVLDQDLPKEKRMIRLKAADGVSFGEMALLENDTRTATVTALTDCKLLELNRDDFLRFIRENSATGIKIMLRLAQLLSRFLRKTDSDVVKLTTALAIALGG
jgi:CRP/FNR family cyclic AMP-dependent transcriptional regulator|uniref:Cyclic nucleotide-binding domain-containing protein n=1 Tax=Desulfobacca acetoxidans TaxID=60893 RepID=A0A7V6A0V8_9BACT